MSGEGNRPSRFAARNARWAHNHRVSWPPEGGPPDDMTVARQGGPFQLPYGNGHTSGNGRANGNGHPSGNVLSRKLLVTLSEDERERLKAEVIYWGLQQAQQGRALNEEDLQAEYDRRLNGAQHLLGDLEVDVQEQYDRARAAE